MTKLIICRGLPASGKTTRALKWVAGGADHRARVNRDSLRLMAHGGEWRGRDTERQIIAIRDAAIATLLGKGISVVCDDTNLPQRTVRDIAKVGRIAGATVEIWDLTDVPYTVCLERDRERAVPIGDAAIMSMYHRFLNGKKHPLPRPEEPIALHDPDRPYVPVPGTPRAIMVDIDGTIALHGTRSPFDESRVHEDLPNHAVIECVRAMALVGYEVIFCSGRTEGCREETERWLTEHLKTVFPTLHMRAVGDTRKDVIVKRELFDREIRDRYTVVGVFDDRQQVVDGWRELGLTVFQVAPGQF